MATLRLSKTMPAGTVVPAARSASTHVLSSQMNVVYPQAQTTYSYAGSNQIQFDVNSGSSFWDPNSSYIRFDLKCELKNNTVDDPARYIAEGGAHALFERMEIYSKAGTLLERIEDYNRLYSMFSTASQPKHVVDDNYAYSADSAHPIFEEPTKSVSFALNGTTIASVTYNAGTKTLAMMGTGGSNCIPGDVIYFRFGTQWYFGVVKTAAAASIVFENSPAHLPAANITAVADDVILNIVGKRGLVQSARSKAATVASYKVCFQPYSSFLSQGTLIPLFLMRGGLRIVLTLARPEYALVTASIPVTAGYSGAKVEIDNPEWVCSYLTPDQGLAQAYLELYNANMIHLFCYGVKRNLNTFGVNAISANITHNVNVRSARFIASRIQDIRARTATTGNANFDKNTYCTDSIAQGLATGLRYYQVISGSAQFPETRPLDFGDKPDSDNDPLQRNYFEAMVHVQKVFGTLGSPMGGMRSDSNEWGYGYKQLLNESGGSLEPQRLILAAYMARDPTPFSGLDLSLNTLQERFEFDRAYEDMGVGAGNRYITSFVVYDQAVTIGSAGIVVQS